VLVEPRAKGRERCRAVAEDQVDAISRCPTINPRACSSVRERLEQIGGALDRLNSGGARGQAAGSDQPGAECLQRRRGFPEPVALALTFGHVRLLGSAEIDEACAEATDVRVEPASCDQPGRALAPHVPEFPGGAGLYQHDQSNQGDPRAAVPHRQPHCRAPASSRLRVSPARMSSSVTLEMNEM
jgi:hypothetical protein